VKINLTKCHFILMPLLCAGVPIICIPAADWLAVSKHGNSALLDISLLFVLMAFAALICLLAALIGLAFARSRRVSALVSLCVTGYLVGLMVSAGIGGRVRMNAFFNLSERSKPLVAAIVAFENEHGHPPENLQALVPKYLPSIPATGMGAYPKYDYLTSATNWYGNPWVLRVSTSLGVLNWDQFIYFPLTNYPATGYGGTLERIGDWAYVHE
jgi:hypothetical protein